MEAFQLERPTPVESLPKRRSRRTVIPRRSDCDSGRETPAASLDCSKHVKLPPTATATTTKEFPSTIVRPADITDYTNTHTTHLPLSPPLQQLAPATSASPTAFTSTHLQRNLWSCFHLRHDLACIMLTMLFLISIVLSGNSGEPFSSSQIQHLCAQNERI